MAVLQKNAAGDAGGHAGRFLTILNRYLERDPPAQLPESRLVGCGRLAKVSVREIQVDATGLNTPETGEINKVRTVEKVE